MQFRAENLFRLFTYSMLLIIHGSYFGQASLTLGKEPREYGINAAPVLTSPAKRKVQRVCQENYNYTQR